jgi:hypothetical protein
MACAYRTTDRETECVYDEVLYTYSTNTQSTLSNKELWISDMIVKLIASIPYEFVSSCNGQVNEPRHLYAARIAKEMADQIFG